MIIYKYSNNQYQLHLSTLYSYNGVCNQAESDDDKPFKEEEEEESKGSFITSDFSKSTPLIPEMEGS